MHAMSIRIQRSARALGAVALLAAVATVGVAGEAAAQSKGKSVQTEAEWIKFDAEAKNITVKVRKAGKRVKVKEAVIKQGKEATFDVKPEGSVLTRTTVKVNGRRGEIADIPAGKRVNIYWVVDEAKPTKRFARTIDVTFTEEELNERFPEDE